MEVRTNHEIFYCDQDKNRVLCRIGVPFPLSRCSFLLFGSGLSLSLLNHTHSLLSNIRCVVDDAPHLPSSSLISRRISQGRTTWHDRPRDCELMRLGFPPAGCRPSSVGFLFPIGSCVYPLCAPQHVAGDPKVRRGHPLFSHLPCCYRPVVVIAFFHTTKDATHHAQTVCRYAASSPPSAWPAMHHLGFADLRAAHFARHPDFLAFSGIRCSRTTSSLVSRRQFLHGFSRFLGRRGGSFPPSSSHYSNQSKLQKARFHKPSHSDMAHEHHPRIDG